MRIWLIGAEQAAIDALQQLRKHRELELFVSAPTDRPKAVTDGVIERVTYVEYVTPVNVNTLARRIRPDLILVDPTADERTYGRVAGGMAFSEALTYELATASDYPCLIL